MTDHPVKVPPELVRQWWEEAVEGKGSDWMPEYVADRAAQWAANYQLEEVNNWIRCLGDHSETGIRWELDPIQLDRLGRELWQAMRPKPPTLAEQGLKALGPSVGLRVLTVAEQDDIRAALNRLTELEAQQ